MHTDDAVSLASSRSLPLLQLKHLLAYCNMSSIKLEASKSQFIEFGQIAGFRHLSLVGGNLSAL